MEDSRPSPDFISQNTGTELIGKRILYYRSVTSTNDIAKFEAVKQAAEGTVIISGRQTAGKGRLKRAWMSPEGSLALSFVLYPAIQYLPYLIMSASLAVSNAIKQVTGIEADIKWPNDVQINGKKVCGILIENSIKGNAVEYAVTGIGININVKTKDYPDIENTATSLSQETGQDIPIADFTQKLLKELEIQYLAGAGVYDAWRDKLITLGKNIRATSGDSVFEGVAESVERDGSLVLRQSNGETINISAGDVTLRT
jgi:BirA family biotin operon repressor/biotin-[acetyl-CoA-carboxylase] ligase